MDVLIRADGCLLSDSCAEFGADVEILSHFPTLAECVGNHHILAAHECGGKMRATDTMGMTNQRFFKVVHTATSTQEEVISFEMCVSARGIFARNCGLARTW